MGNKLREFIESRPFITLLGVTVTVASVTTGVNQFYDRKHVRSVEDKFEIQVADLERRTDSIAVRIGDEQEFLDVRDWVIDPRDAREEVPNSELLDNSFYALLPTDGEWDYMQSEVSSLPNVLTGGTFSLSEPLVDHVWESNSAPLIDGDRIPATIRVRVLPESFFETIFGLTYESLADVFGELATDDLEQDQVEEVLDEAYRSDAAMLMLFSAVSPYLVSQADDFRTRWNTLQKSGNVVYIEFDTNVGSVELDGQPVDELFLAEQLYLVSVPEGLLTVAILVPTHDFKDAEFLFIKQWLASFAVPVRS